MSKLAKNINFDLQLLNNQGAYLSSYTPQTIAQYFQPITLPEYSSYHLVGCYNPPLMAKCNIEPILINYLNASQQMKNQIIIDLCLPFHHNKMGRTFMGRYIIFKGNLVGIKLSTASNIFYPSFFSWPKHRAKICQVKILGKDVNILIGQISLNLLNARIGLMFESQIATSAQQYINYGFDFIALTYQIVKQKQEIVSLKLDLSKHILFLESDVGNIQSYLKKQNIGLITNGSKDKSLKSTIYMQYYQFQKKFQKKQSLYLSQQQLHYITSIQINTSLMRKKYKSIHFASQNNELFIQSYSVGRHFQHNNIDKYIRRLYLYYYRCDFKKIIVKGQESPLFICFVHLLEKTIQQYQKQQPLNIRHMFQIIGMKNNQLSNILSRFKHLKLYKKFLQKQQKKEAQILYLVRVFTFIMQHWNKQHYFPIITNDQQTINVIHMLNQQQKNKLERGELGSQNSMQSDLSDREASNGIKTWIVTEFFTHQQLKQLYHSTQIKQIINNQAYHSQIWSKYLKNRQIRQENQTTIKRSKLQCLIQKDSSLMRDFLQHYSKVQIVRQNCRKQQIFAHFLFKTITRIQQNHTLPNLMQQFLITPQLSIMKLFKFMNSQNVNPLSSITSRIALNSIAFARQQSSNKNKCHQCQFDFFPQLMYKCKNEICQQNFCYQCILKFECFSSYMLRKQNTTIQSLKNIKLCPICKGLCLNCKKCDAKKNRLQLIGQKSVNIAQVECHLCRKTNSIYQYKCSLSNCRKQFCLHCIQQSYRVKTNILSEDNWICFVCQNRCYCNKCELQKAKLMNLVIERPIKLKIQEQQQQLKKRNKKQQVFINKDRQSQMKVKPRKSILKGSQKMVTKKQLYRQDKIMSAFYANVSGNIDQISSQNSCSTNKTKKPKKAKAFSQQQVKNHQQNQQQEETCLEKPNYRTVQSKRTSRTEKQK